MFNERKIKDKGIKNSDVNSDIKETLFEDDGAYEKMIKDFEEQEANKYDYPEQF